MNALKDPRQPHDHAFGQDQKQSAEGRTWWVVMLTVVTMLVEIFAGITTGSMALLADGLHMGSHAIALGINGIAYWYARRQAFNPDFSFGTGKINALGGYTGALLLGVFGVGMAWESLHRMINPHAINFDIAIMVAVVGLVINAVSVLILGGGQHHSHASSLASHHGHTHPHQPTSTVSQPGRHDHAGDHNLRSAYLHVLTDALTSVLAILALIAGKYAGLNWLDAAMGIVGSVLIVRWSIQLLREASATLLDKQVSDATQARVRSAIEAECDDKVTDLHVWSVGPGLLAAEIVVLTQSDADAHTFRERLPHDLGLVHATIEVHQTPPQT